MLSINTHSGRPVIDIASPTVLMQEKAIEITERIRGRLTTAYLHHKRECGCIIRWQPGEVPVKASIVIDVLLDTDNNQIRYDVALQEGDCTGLNQLAQALMQKVKDRLSQNQNQTSQE